MNLLSKLRMNIKTIGSLNNEHLSLGSKIIDLFSVVCKLTIICWVKYFFKF
jgi:hypothetical protein